tara:strand:- start:98 stop:622 length:525 start_codon:yes stop_codon:yes gene_type:complete
MARTTLHAGMVTENTLEDDDGDTKVQVEEAADEDKIRFDTAGSERMIITNAGAVGIGITLPRSTLSLKGSFSRVLRTASSNTTLTISDSTVLVDASGGNITATLPSASNITGRIYTVKRIDSTGSYSTTLAVATGDTLEGVANDTAGIAQGQSLTVQCTGSGWVIIAEYIAPLP